MLRIVVTGGAGYVGLPLCRQLASHGHTVTVIDSLVYGDDRLEALRQFATVRRVDITEPSVVAAVVDAEPQVVIHLAALHFIPECNRRPVDAVRINVLGTQMVLDACARVPGLARVVVTSSAAVYPVSDAFFTEEDAPAPTDIYGITKAVNERQAADFTERTGIPTAVVRLFNVFGPGETNPHLLPEIVNQVRAGASRVSLGNTTPKRCYIYIDDVVDAFEAVATTALPSAHTILNVGHRDEASVLELLDMLSTALGKRITAEQHPDRVRTADRLFLRCDPSLVHRLTGWEARYSIAEGMRRFMLKENLA